MADDVESVDRTQERRLARGYVQLYTGNGKGKTTAALGLALHDHPLITLEQYGDVLCIRREEVTAEHIVRAQQGLARARAAMLSGRYALIVLDEVNVAIWFGMLPLSDVLALLDERPPQVELVLTGRRAPDELIARADLVTEMREVKHYYVQGVTARVGIER